MYINGTYDQAAAIVEGIRLGKEVVADERLHTLVILRRYDASEGREVMFGVHAYGDDDENGNPAFSTVGLMNADYRVGVTDAIHLGAKWGYYPADMADEDTRNYVLHNICPIEWHKLPFEEWGVRVDFYTRDCKPPRAADDTAFMRKWGVWEDNDTRTTVHEDMSTDHGPEGRGE